MEPHPLVQGTGIVGMGRERLAIKAAGCLTRRSLRLYSICTVSYWAPGLPLDHWLTLTYIVLREHVQTERRYFFFEN